MTPVSSVQEPKAPPAKGVRPAGSTEGSASAPAAKPSVLLLEDDVPFSRFVSGVLSENGFEVVSVRNGVDGVHKVLAQDFDAILCDILLPTLPGDMFYRAVERMRPHLCNRFVFMTGNYDQPKVKEFMATGQGMMLLKPFHIDDLREMLAFVELRNLHLAN